MNAYPPLYRHNSVKMQKITIGSWYHTAVLDVIKNELLYAYSSISHAFLNSLKVNTREINFNSAKTDVCCMKN